MGRVRGADELEQVSYPPITTQDAFERLMRDERPEGLYELLELLEDDCFIIDSENKLDSTFSVESLSLNMGLKTQEMFSELHSAGHNFDVYKNALPYLYSQRKFIVKNGIAVLICKSFMFYEIPNYELYYYIDNDTLAKAALLGQCVDLRDYYSILDSCRKNAVNVESAEEGEEMEEII
jgi:hypothetical protein